MKCREGGRCKLEKYGKYTLICAKCGAVSQVDDVGWGGETETQIRTSIIPKPKPRAVAKIEPRPQSRPKSEPAKPQRWRAWWPF